MTSFFGIVKLYFYQGRYTWYVRYVRITYSFRNPLFPVENKSLFLSNIREDYKILHALNRLLYRESVWYSRHVEILSFTWKAGIYNFFFIFEKGNLCRWELKKFFIKNSRVITGIIYYCDYPNRLHVSCKRGREETFLFSKKMNFNLSAAN